MDKRLLAGAIVLIAITAFLYWDLERTPAPITQSPVSSTTDSQRPEATSSPIVTIANLTEGGKILLVPSLRLSLTVPAGWFYEAGNGYFDTAAVQPDGLGASDFLIATSSGSFDDSTAVNGTDAAFALLQASPDGSDIPDANQYSGLNPYTKIENTLVSGFPAVFLHKDAPPDSDGQALDLIWVRIGAVNYYISIWSPEANQSDYDQILASVELDPTLAPPDPNLSFQTVTVEDANFGLPSTWMATSTAEDGGARFVSSDYHALVLPPDGGYLERGASIEIGSPQKVDASIQDPTAYQAFEESIYTECSNCSDVQKITFAGAPALQFTSADWNWIWEKTAEIELVHDGESYEITFDMAAPSPENQAILDEFIRTFIFTK